MTNSYTLEDLLGFLSHTENKGIMPVATSRALALAVRNVFGVLDDDEQKDISSLDLGAVIKRFNNKRAKDFSPRSLKEYARRAERAVELYGQWKANPAEFSVKTRSTNVGRQRKGRMSQGADYNEYPAESTSGDSTSTAIPSPHGTYQSSFPVGPGRVVTLSNIPEDLTSGEAERLAQFVRLLAID